MRYTNLLLLILLKYKTLIVKCLHVQLYNSIYQNYMCRGDSKTSLSNEMYTIIICSTCITNRLYTTCFVGYHWEYCWHVCLNVFPELDIGIAIPIVFYLQVQY